MTKAPLLARAVATAAVLVAVMVAIGGIRGKVQERERRAREVATAFAQETSGPQSIAGPFLLLTCEEPGRGPCPAGLFAPQALEATATLPVETRRRGIYAIRVFHADVEITALLGSVLVFAVLAFAMGATRKVDWGVLAGRLAAGPNSTEQDSEAPATNSASGTTTSRIIAS